MPKPPVKPPDDAELLKLEEVAYLLGLPSIIPVKILIEQGKLPAIRVTVGGHILRIQRDHVSKYIRAKNAAEHPELAPEPIPPDEAARDREREMGMCRAEWNTGQDMFEPKRPSRRKANGNSY